MKVWRGAIARADALPTSLCGSWHGAPDQYDVSDYSPSRHLAAIPAVGVYLRRQDRCGRHVMGAKVESESPYNQVESGTRQGAPGVRPEFASRPSVSGDRVGCSNSGGYEADKKRTMLSGPNLQVNKTIRGNRSCPRFPTVDSRHRHSVLPAGAGHGCEREVAQHLIGRPAGELDFSTSRPWRRARHADKSDYDGRGRILPGAGATKEKNLAFSGPRKTGDLRLGEETHDPGKHADVRKPSTSDSSFRRKD